MNSISAALRIVYGVALIIFSYSTYHRISQHAEQLCRIKGGPNLDIDPSL